MHRRWRHWAICALIVAVSVAGARLSGRTSFFRLLHLKLLDTHFIVRGPQPAANIVLVMMDQKATDAYTEPMVFWHPHYIEAIRAAGEAGAKVIGLDIAFGVRVEKWEKDLDELLAAAVISSPIPVVLGYATELNTNQATNPVQVNMVAAGLGLAGYPNVTVDDDRFVRTQEIIDPPDPNSPPGTPLEHALALRVAEKYLGAEAEFVNGRVMLQGREVPVVKERTIAINFAGPSGTFPRVSLVEFEAASKRGDIAQLRKWVEGKIVLLGTDDKGDRKETPFYTMFKGSEWATPGVEVHASTVHTLVDHAYLQLAPNWALVTSLLVFCTATVFFIIRLNTRPAALWIVAVILAVAAFTHLLFRAGWILSTAELFTGITFCGLAAGLYRYWTTQQRGALFRKAISLFVGHQVATSLEESEEISLTSRRLSVTILFTDIRGFTAFTEKMCEEQGPEIVVTLLNEYMSMMVSLIVEANGHVNKFIGDGILAVFCDEDKGAVSGDHARRAVACATKMVTASSQFKTGAGLHTGLAVLGNVGSPQKMEFTVLGDTVNLASRLESLNKEMHTSLLMSEATQRELGEKIETVKLGAMPVRGKAAPIFLYTVAALAPAPAEKTPVHA